MTERPPLHNRLLALRDDLLRQLDDAGLPDTTEPMVRAVVANAPGLPITLALYGDGVGAVAVEVSPIRAVTLAGQLIEAALPRLRDAGSEPAYSGPQRARISQ